MFHLGRFLFLVPRSSQGVSVLEDLCPGVYFFYNSRKILTSNRRLKLLPFANEVWGKVIFLKRVSFYSGGTLYYVTSCLTAWSHVPSRKVSVPGPTFLSGSLCLGGSLSGGSLSRGSLSRGICPGGLYLGGSLSRGSLSRGSLSGASLSRRGLCPGGSQTETTPWWTSEQYVSYWNAVLYVTIFIYWTKLRL